MTTQIDEATTASTDNPAYALAWTLTHFEVKDIDPDATPETVRDEFRKTQDDRLRLAHKVIAALDRRGFRIVKD
ncbi:hypothetical protein GI374_15885 [Paracoccus sp. S-4012]|uniref:hypothetical protein n=1 Tax=Paracoccus sp. S-4012 TaxID=2665648 RepID=UPI0012B11BB7|nr:hypothetical protein [Paracoccus sp. S-4012]MRX51873.1 hypothetical protein [Paracoccus sp. S-4012]